MIYPKLNNDSTSILLDPACQKIDTQRQCYVMKPFCKDQKSGEDTVNPNPLNLALYLVAVVVVVVSVVIALLFIKRSRKSAKGAYNEYKSSSYLLTNDVI